MRSPATTRRRTRIRSGCPSPRRRPASSASRRCCRSRSSAGFRHTEAGPPALRTLGLAEWLSRTGVAAEWTAMIDPARFWRDHPEATQDEVFELVAAHNAALAAAVEAALRRRHRPVV